MVAAVRHRYNPPDDEHLIPLQFSKACNRVSYFSKWYMLLVNLTPARPTPASALTCPLSCMCSALALIRPPPCTLLRPVWVLAPATAASATAAEYANAAAELPVLTTTSKGAAGVNVAPD